MMQEDGWDRMVWDDRVISEWFERRFGLGQGGELGMQQVWKLLETSETRATLWKYLVILLEGGLVSSNHASMVEGYINTDRSDRNTVHEPQGHNTAPHPHDKPVLTIIPPQTYPLRPISHWGHARPEIYDISSTDKSAWRRIVEQTEPSVVLLIDVDM